MSHAAFIETDLTEDQALRRVRIHAGKTAYRPNWPAGRCVFVDEPYGKLFLRESDDDHGVPLLLSEEDSAAHDWVVST